MELARRPEDQVVGPLGERVVEQRDRGRHVEAVVGIQLENRVRGVLVDRVESEQLGRARAVQREIAADHDDRAGGTHVDATVRAVQAIEVALERGHPREPEMRQRHGLRVLTERVAGHHGAGVLAREAQQDAPQAVRRLHDREQAVALGRVDRDRAQIAGASRQVQASADVLAEGPDQVLLAGMETAAVLQPHGVDTVLLHLAEGAQDRLTRVAREQAFLHEHDGVRLVERVDRIEHRARSLAGEAAEFRKHLLAESNARGTEAAIFAWWLFQHAAHATAGSRAESRAARRAWP